MYFIVFQYVSMYFKVFEVPIEYQIYTESILQVAQVV